MRHLSNAVRVPKDDANLRRGQTLPGELAHVLGDLTRVDLQPRRRRPPVRQSRLRDTLPVSRKASRRAKPEARRLTSTHSARRGSRQRRAKAGLPRARRPNQPAELRLQTWPPDGALHSGTHPLLCMRPMTARALAFAAVDFATRGRATPDVAIFPAHMFDEITKLHMGVAASIMSICSGQ